MLLRRIFRSHQYPVDISPILRNADRRELRSAARVDPLNDGGAPGVLTGLTTFQEVRQWQGGVVYCQHKLSYFHAFKGAAYVAVSQASPP